MNAGLIAVLDIKFNFNPLAGVFLTLAVLSMIVRMKRRRRMTCSWCKSVSLDEKGVCKKCGGKAGQGFEVIPRSKDS